MIGNAQLYALAIFVNLYPRVSNWLDQLIILVPDFGMVCLRPADATIFESSEVDCFYVLIFSKFLLKKPQ